MQSRQRHSGHRHAHFDKDKDKFRINGGIKAQEVRLIDESGSVLGTYSIKEALEKAREQELDLVEISPTNRPPICKIFNYNKFIYQREKKRKEAKRHQKTFQLKEIKFRPQTDVHDYNFKVKHIKEFLEHGDKVKVTIRFKGRELAFKDLGYKKIMQVMEDIKEVGKVELPAKMEGRTLFMTVGPLRTTPRETKEPAKDKELRPVTEHKESKYSKRLKERLAEDAQNPTDPPSEHPKRPRHPVSNRIGNIVKIDDKK